MESLRKNETWDLVMFFDRTISSKWVFKKKINTIRQVEKYNAQLVPKGYFQVEGVNFGEIFYLVEK